MDYKGINSYKKVYAEIQAIRNNLKCRNNKDKFKIADRFLREQRPMEVLKHFSRESDVEPSDSVKKYLLDIMVRAEFVDAAGVPTERAKELGIFTKRKSRSKLDNALGLVITPFGQLALYVEVYLFLDTINGLKK